jgi:ribosomal protein S12 methylthiotransferase accessory factor
MVHNVSPRLPPGYVRQMIGSSETFLHALDGMVADDASDHTRALVRVAHRMERIFQLPVSDAPGLHLVGGMLDAAAFGVAPPPRPFSVTGTGLDVLRATTACVSEGVEFLSQLARADAAFTGGTAGQVAHGLPADAVADLLAPFRLADTDNIPLRWTSGLSVAGGDPVLLPAALCYRNVRDPDVPEPAIKMSTGCGVGPTCEAAQLHALLELIERDAIALWWLGGRKGRRALAQPGLPPVLQVELQRDASRRTSWLLDITTDLGVPCIAALSTDAAGRGLVCGFAARLDRGEAIRAAVFEMCQMEVGLGLILLKHRHGGEGALNDAERSHLRRSFGFDVRGCELLFGDDEPVAEGRSAIAAEIASPAGLARHLERHGIVALWTDLTRPDLAVPAVRALAPGLQPYPSDVILRRLERQIQATGGGFGLTGGIALM